MAAVYFRKKHWAWHHFFCTIGTKKLTSFSSAYSERVFVGLSLFHGILFVPRINVPIVLKAGIYEEVLNSKLYNFNVGVKIGVGVMF
jgi:hypothetical protein